MGSQTANLRIPYPTGTDRVADGDNAMQAIAERVEARMAWGWLAYVALTTAVNITASQTVLTLPAVTLIAGRRCRLSAFAPVAYTGGATQAEIRMTNQANIVHGRAYLHGPVGGAAGGFLYTSRVFDAAAGSTTFRLDAWFASVAWTLNAETTNPGYLVLEDVGPTSLA